MSSTDEQLDLADANVDPGLLFDQAMEQTRMSICLTDPNLPDNPMVLVNRAFCELTGYSRDELVGRNCRLLQGPDTSGATVELLRTAIRDEEVVVVEILNYRKDGDAFWNALHLGPIYDAHGRLQYFFGSQWDVSQMHAARADLHLARMFSRELAHRMKNLFAVISGIVSMSARDEGVPRVARAINERIAALGRAYDDAFASDSLTNAELGRVARLTLAPYVEGAPERVRIRGERVMIRPTTVSLLGLALHELAINALKHGALAVESGTVDLNWAFDGQRALVVQWDETLPETVEAPREPPGAAEESARRSGSGHGILDELLHAAGGRIDTRVRDDGRRVRLSLPLDGVIESPWKESDA